MALLQARARSRALARLAALYPYTFEVFYADEFAKEERRRAQVGTSCA